MQVLFFANIHSRRVRCDRQNPCSTCSKRGFARSCIYSNDAKETILPRSAGTVHERLHQLETLVISLMQQDRSSPGSITVASKSDTPNVSPLTNLNPDAEQLGRSVLQSPVVTAFPSANSSACFVSGVDTGANDNVSPVSLNCGIMQVNGLGNANYVGSAHWAAVLDSIAELKVHCEWEEENRQIATEHDSWPQLLYGCQRATEAIILSSIPPRELVDKLVSKYFTLDIAPGESIVPKLETYLSSML